MNIYDDNRLTRWGQRRLHSAFEESGANQTWTVPAIASEIASAVTPTDWDRGRRNIEAAIQAGDNVLRHRVQLWWNEQWSNPKSQYAVRVLTPEERAITEEMVVAMEKTMHPAGFLKVAGDLRDHPDAIAICETVATGSTLFITKDEAAMITPVINDWIEQHAPKWQISNAPAVVDVDDAMLRWGKDNPRSLAEVALLAYWPEDRNESNEAVIRQTRACLRSIGIGGTPTLAAFAIAQVNTFASDQKWMQMLRETPVTRTREAERLHPGRQENQPEELAIRDPGVSRSIRPSGLKAPSRVAAEAAARRATTPRAGAPEPTQTPPGHTRDD